MQLKIIYEDGNVLVIDKPPGIAVYQEGKGETLIVSIAEQYPEIKEAGDPPRYGMVHRLDKDTSGILLVAKNNQTLSFLQKQFQEGTVRKLYIALVIGNLPDNTGRIETLIGRAPSDRKKQKVYLSREPEAQGKRSAITEYRVVERFEEYSLIEVIPKTGRKHQIRCHFAYLQHPIAGDTTYGFKNQPCPRGLGRHFLHASLLRIQLPTNKIKEFRSELPNDLQNVLEQLKSYANKT